ncbi:MAG: beta-N-acetylhexosaminidase [Myxococcales bacterium]|nr:beta-N-acetylhexosaminidase [Myxococcales bacterium]
MNISPVGQLVMLGFPGLQVLPALAELIEHYDISGVFLFGPNIETHAQVRQLIADLQRRAPTPMLVAMDQEGGRVQQWGPPHGPILPSARDLGQRFERDLSLNALRAHGKWMGGQLADLGVNVDFAPVLDVDTCESNPIIGDRSFSADPTIAAKLALAWTAGLQDAGVLGCGKHFPGHGDTARDSHLELPIVDVDRQRLDAVELAPFRAAIAAQIPTLMTAHVVYPALDPGQPATTSHRICTQLLRHELGFKGLLFTDDLAMRGIRDGNEDLVDVSVRAINAGCDVLLSCTEHDAHPALLAGLERAWHSGQLNRDRVLESVQRVHAAKRRLGLIAQ